ncbi:MAG: radical SAM protein [Chloroflexota bacterium]
MSEERAWPSYLGLAQAGELRRRAELAAMELAHCTLCARACGANRAGGERGECGAGPAAGVHSWAPHFGEEPPLVGRGGSGTIFFTRCSLKCIYCQNWEISQKGVGDEASAEQLAAIMLRLQAAGCHNINLVSPTHVVPQFLAGLSLAAEAGLGLPVVYNTGGFDSISTLRLLDGVVDIYMPDMKYADGAVAQQLSGVKGYPLVNRRAVREMHRQVGDLTMDDRGIALTGLLVRHLVLPDGLAGTAAIVRFLAEEISPETYLNIMDQYRPEYLASSHRPINRRITRHEFGAAIQLARTAGLHCGF